MPFPTDYPHGCPSGGHGSVTNDQGTFPIEWSGDDPNCGGGGGDVDGPAGATPDDLVAFDGATGKLIKDSGFKPTDFDPVGAADAAVADHDAAPDPHPQYLVQAEADALYDPLGAAATAESAAEAYADAAVAAHEAAVDPHPQYETQAESDARYVQLTDPRLTDSRAPTGPAGGDLSGTYPNPDIAAGVIVNADVNAAAGIVESKLALNFPTHSNANDPSAGEKAALAGTSGTPGVGNKYVTDADARNTNARTPTAHATSHQPGGTDPMDVDAAAATGSLRTLGTGAAQACAGNDSRLSDSRPPNGTAGGDLAGTYPNPTVAKASNSFALAGVITVDQGAGPNVNDWNPTGLANAVVIRMTNAGSITGIVGGASGRILVLYNARASGSIGITNNGAGSTAANRFSLPNGIALILQVNEGVAFVYDSTDSRWKLLTTGNSTTFLGSNGSTAGARGTVPAPDVADNVKILTGDGNWSTLSAVLDFIGSAAQGDLLYRGASTWARLGAGTSGQFLKTLGAGANPAWADLGSLVGTQDLAAGVTTYTPTAGTKRALVWLCGAGGGGGAADWTSGTTFAGAGGGGAGSQALYRIAAVSGTYTVSIGTGGAAGTVGVNSGTGGTGGDTTFTNGGTTVTAKGGVGAVSSAAGSAVATSLGGGGGAIATNGSINPGAGDTGQHGVTLSGTVGWSGKGGHCHPFGSGGASRTAQANGIAGVGFGSGGSGGVATSADRTGGAGADGRIWVFEFA